MFSGGILEDMPNIAGIKLTEEQQKQYQEYIRQQEQEQELQYEQEEHERTKRKIEQIADLVNGALSHIQTHPVLSKLMGIKLRNTPAEFAREALPAVIATYPELTPDEISAKAVAIGISMHSMLSES